MSSTLLAPKSLPQSKKNRQALQALPVFIC
jgi:hypothetical protein